MPGIRRGDKTACLVRLIVRMPQHRWLRLKLGHSESPDRLRN